MQTANQWAVTSISSSLGEKNPLIHFQGIIYSTDVRFNTLSSVQRTMEVVIMQGEPGIFHKVWSEPFLNYNFQIIIFLREEQQFS